MTFATPSLPNPLRRLTGYLDDRMNPIVVKELRQAVKSRFVVAVLMLLLVVLLVTLVLMLLNLDPGRDFDDQTGAQLFMVFQSILLATCMLFVPIYVGVRLAAERATTTSDLLYVTTIRPSSIVWGKLLAGMVVTGLAFSACAPFMVITFLLRGIDPPTIVFILFLDAMIVLAATQVAIFVATMPLGWPIKALLGLVLLGVSFSGFIAMTGWISFSLLGLGVGSMLDDPDFWIGMGITLACWLAAVAMLFFLSVAVIAPPTANRALLPRLYFTLVLLVSFVGFSYLVVRFTDTDPLEAWLVFVTIFLTLAALISASERETFGPRLRRTIPRFTLLRLPAFLLYSGAAGGLLWSALLYALTLGGVWAVVSQRSPLPGFTLYDGMMGDWLARFTSVGFWVFGYLLLAVLFCRRLLPIKNGSLVTGVVGLCLMAIASIVPMIIAYALDPDRWDLDPETWLMLNPFGPIMAPDGDWDGAYGMFALPLSAGFFALMVLVNVPWFFRQWKAFRPPPPEQSQPPQVDTPPPAFAINGEAPPVSPLPKDETLATPDAEEADG
jgi:hypothetical protein